MHHACRHGAERVFDVLVAAGADVTTADDCGKTPMHDCVWSASPSFKIAARILDMNESILRGTDRLNATPLEYAHPSRRALWREFLSSNVERWWPHKPLKAAPVKGNMDIPPQLPTCKQAPGTPPPAAAYSPGSSSAGSSCVASSAPVASTAPLPKAEAHDTAPTQMPAAAHSIVHNASWLAIRSFAEAIAGGASFASAAGSMHPSPGLTQPLSLNTLIPHALSMQSLAPPHLIPAGQALQSAGFRCAAPSQPSAAPSHPGNVSEAASSVRASTASDYSARSNDTACTAAAQGTAAGGHKRTRASTPAPAAQHQSGAILAHSDTSTSHTLNSTVRGAFKLAAPGKRQCTLLNSA